MRLERTVLKNILTKLVVAAIFVLTVIPSFADDHSKSASLLQVGDSIVKRIMPKPESDSIYVATDYTEVHFKLNKADLDLNYMNNGYALTHLNRVVDSLGVENISAIEIISQSSPDGSLSRNEWLTEHRSKVILDYMYRAFPELKSKISLNTVTESWENLAMYVAQDPNLSEKNINKILDIIDSRKLSVNAKKSRLKNNLGKDPKVGNIYAYLTKYYYPVIRNSGIYILHMVEPATAFNMDPLRPYVEVEGAVFPDSIDYTLPKKPLPQKPAEPVPDEKPPVEKRPLLAVKTNLPYYAFYRKDLGWAPIYNVEAELYPTEEGRWTWLLEYEFPWHSVTDKHQYFQILNLQFEARRYFRKNSNHSGHYLSAYVGANLFDICFDSKGGHGYQGEGGGAGLGYGYVLPLGKKQDTRWKLEFFIKGGAYVTLYDPYDAGSPFAGKYYYEWYDAPGLFRRRNMIFRWLGPTGAGITLSYDLIFKKKKRTETPSAIIDKSLLINPKQ